MTKPRRADAITQLHFGITAKEHSDNHGLDCGHDPDTGEVCEGMTDPSFKDDCDINKILDRYAKTGILPDMIEKQPQYGDFASVPDFMTAQNTVVKANEQFAGLDAHIRKRFHNDPAEFLEFATNPENQDEMIKMKLATRKNTEPATQPAQGSTKTTKPKGDPQPKEKEQPKAAQKDTDT